MGKDSATSLYELVLILKSDKEEILGRLTKFIEDHSGNVTKKDSWGKKNFEYPIKKESSGYYFDWQISLEKKNIKDLKKNLDYDEEVLRYLLIRE